MRVGQGAETKAEANSFYADIAFKGSTIIPTH